MNTILEGRGIVKTFGDFTALHGIDLRLEPGRTLGVVGESGSGKSTLGRIVMRLMKPDAGTVLLGGRDLFALSRSQLRRARRDFQLVPQDPRNALNPTATVGESLMFQLAAQGVARREWRTRIDDLLQTVSLSGDYAHAYPHELSGGQAQRVAIARAIAGRPRLLVCDEAVSALDKSVQAQVLNTFAELQSGLGVALFFITHDLAVVEHIADDLLVLNRGRAVEEGPTVDVLHAPSDPYTRELLAARHPIPAA
ncbi:MULTISPECIES: ABC transporter ATP-binding protein [Microbacterium]|uniref:ABC transporter ATP-binding protein n=1 Tax=Microbacterium TaxID=33882 RepID=UPI0027838CF5|nr:MULTISPECIES: ABC transporter ATP-binding protein [Microbacterium]MDQ1083714.1 ABC-type glutathione transport system ATPase component [Microbacterium sp. SORGH_AS_0344]MDQ1171009.1 ABC-type glutathione transport system ATPase component [Microbacterium proteolyticum]